MNIPETIELDLTEEIFNRSGNYLNSENCLVATALKERFPNSFIYVRGFEADISQTRFTMSREDAYKVVDIYKLNIPLPQKITLTKSLH